jgi:hypothetical protein
MITESDLKIAFRNGWLLWLVSVAFIVLFFVFVLYFAYNAPKPGWEMGGKQFVPAQSEYGEGYYLPVNQPEKGEAQ